MSWSPQFIKYMLKRQLLYFDRKWPTAVAGGNSQADSKIISCYLKVVVASVSLFRTLIHMTFTTSLSKHFNMDIKILGNHPCYSFDLPCPEIKGIFFSSWNPFNFSQSIFIFNCSFGISSLLKEICINLWKHLSCKVLHWIHLRSRGKQSFST